MDTVDARRSVRELVGHPSAVLLAVQLVGVLIYPFFEQTVLGRGLFEAFGALVLALAVWAVPGAPWRTWLAVALGVTAIVLSIWDAVNEEPFLAGTSAAFHALFYFWAATSLMVYMLADVHVTVDELFAVGATFTLLAWAFAYVFTLLQIVQPGCFTAAVNPTAQRTWMELLFLSFTNLTSTGLSDVAPITAHSRSFVMIEQICGLGYVALFVSRLVGLTVTRALLRRESD
jgi:hypothetical protein